MEIIQHIEMRDGQAVIKGHGHLKAKMVARQYLWWGMSIEEVVEHYEILTPAEVHAAITFYLDNEEELDEEYNRQVEAARPHAMTLEKFKAKIAERQKQQEQQSNES